MAPPNFYFQKPAVVEIVITNFRGSLFWYSIVYSGIVWCRSIPSQG